MVKPTETKSNELRTAFSVEDDRVRTLMIDVKLKEQQVARIKQKANKLNSDIQTKEKK
ncbi:MAG: hypothetical protein Q8784_01365 [Vigna little leaf phytoplasma]|nr:hypothetical protein [Vigna little leaf phytoplasma]